MPDTVDLSRVIPLANKGGELLMKGHFARAAEKFSRAAEEAEKALPDLTAWSCVRCATTSSMRCYATLQRRRRGLLMRMMRFAMPACACCRL
jgi:hypothetical protein